MSREGLVPPRGNAKSEAGTERSAAGSRARAPGEASGDVSGSLAGVASLKRNKGEDAEAGKPEMGKSVVKERRDSERETARVRDREARRGIQCRVRSNKRI